MDEAVPATDRRARMVAVVLAGGALLFLGFSVITFINSIGWGYDFEAYYWAALRLARGDSIYREHTLAGPFSPGPWGLYLYAPPLAAITLPFTLVSLDAATKVWFAIRIGMLGLGCAVMPVRPAVRLLTFAVSTVSLPVLIDLNLGNVSVVVMVLLAITWRWLDRPIGSVALAAAMSVRPTLGLLLGWWLLRRLWRPVVWTIATGLVMIAFTLPIVGVHSYVDYVTVLRNVTEVTGVWNNLDLGSTMVRMGLGPVVATIALYAGYALAIGATLLSLRYDREVSYMVTIGATMLLAPLLWDHYLASLALPAAFLAQRGRTWGLALPLLAWLPQPFLPFLAVAGTILPFVVARSSASRVAVTDAAPATDGQGDVPGVAAEAPAPAAEAPALEADAPAPGMVVEPQVVAATSIGASNTTASPG